MAGAANPNAQRIAEMPFSVVRGPPGSYAAEWLAGLLEGWDRWQGCVWLRASNARPDTLAGPLASACLHRWIGAAELEQARLEVTPSPGLDEVLRQSPIGAVIVLELAGRLTSDIERLAARIRSVIAGRGVSVVAVTESRIPMASAAARHTWWRRQTSLDRAPTPKLARSPAGSWSCVGLAQRLCMMFWTP
jgi:hypothetical protein